MTIKKQLSGVATEWSKAMLMFDTLTVAPKVDRIFSGLSGIQFHSDVLSFGSFFFHCNELLENHSL